MAHLNTRSTWKKFKSEAEKNQSMLSEYYHVPESEVHLVELDSAADLTKNWNNMGTVAGKTVSIDTVIIDTDGDPNALSGFKKPGSFTAMDTMSLKEKNVGNLILFGCNVGHTDYGGLNLAGQFARRVSGAQVLASDGTVGPTFGELLGWNVFGLFPMGFKSMNDTIFKELRNIMNPDSTRDNNGWLIYQNINGQIEISSSLGKSLTLREMLDILWVEQAYSPADNCDQN